MYKFSEFFSDRGCQHHHHADGSARIGKITGATSDDQFVESMVDVMPDPKELRVDDKVRFVSLPDEWADPDFRIHDESAEFMEALIRRGRPARVYEVDDDGWPWIKARLLEDDGEIHEHTWLIFEKTGWVRVQRRK